LQNTQRLIDDTQLRLATGLKVNSALDNPQNFFAAQSLNNRASDLTRLLDGIGQSIRTVETADQGVTALTSLIEQAQSIVNQARDELAASEGEARIVGSVDLSDIADLTTLANVGAGGLDFRISTTDDSGTLITEEVALNAGDTAYDLAARITNAFSDNQNGEITANITDEGFLSIQSSDGRSFRIVDGDVAGPGGTPVTLAGFSDLGLGSFFEDETRGAATLASTTVVAGNTATSISLFESTGNLVEAGDVLTGSYTDADGTTVLGGLEANDTINITLDVDGTATPAAAVFTVAAGDTFQDLVDYINTDANIGDLVEANFDSSTGQISITSLDDSVRNAEISFTEVAGTADGGITFDIGLGDPSGALDPVTVGIGETQDVVFTFNNSTETLDALAGDYNSLREQIDSLVADAQYRGINLLNGDDLTTFFNENNTSTLTTEGVDFTSNGLSITEATFRSSSEIELSATQARGALEDVRSFGASLANDLAIITSRRDFTENTINTLQAGADDLTVADQNEEGANLLALQTRQTLGVTSLSLASQSQQSVLRLF
jgi:flagellin-like hook-associated protein FlgL